MVAYLHKKLNPDSDMSGCSGGPPPRSSRQHHFSANPPPGRRDVYNNSSTSTSNTSFYSEPEPDPQATEHMEKSPEEFEDNDRWS